MQNQDRVGEQLGNYRLIQLIGKGGYADVYLAQHLHIDVQAAIKVLHRRVLDPAEELAFRNEASIIAKLHHPNIVRIIDFGVDVNRQGVNGSTPYLIMEYAPNGTLRRRYPPRTQIPPPSIVPMLNQIASALQYAHDQKVKHLDIKPENMLVGEFRQIVLSDFGIAIKEDTGLIAPNPIQIQQQLAHHKIVGTAAYMAPELFEKRPSRASDQYALGVVVYEWLSGSRPFEGDNNKIVYDHINTPPPALSGRLPHVTKEIEQVVTKVLAKDPAQRYPSVENFANAFEQAVRYAHQQAGGAPVGPQPPNTQRAGQQQAGAQAGPQPPTAPVAQQQAGVPGWPQPPTAPAAQQQAGVAGALGQQANAAGPPIGAQAGPPPFNPVILPALGTATPFNPGNPTFGNVPPAPPSNTNAVLPTTTGPFWFMQDVNHLLSGPRKVIQPWIRTNNDYNTMEKGSFFRLLGRVLNVISVIILGVTQHSWVWFFFSLVFSLGLFQLCILFEKRVMAYLCGFILAVYWMIVGVAFESAIVSVPLLSGLPAPWLIGLLFLVISAYLHIRYVRSKDW